MLKEANCLLLNQLSDHIAEDCANGVEPLIGCANVRQANVIEKDLLDDENRNGFAQFRTGLHDAKAEGNDLRGEQEIDHVRGVILHQSPNDTQRGETKVFERAGLRGRVEEGV